MTGPLPSRFSLRAKSRAYSKAARMVPTQAAPISAAVQLNAPATTRLPSAPGAQGKRVVAGAFSWTAALIGAACVGTMRAAFEYALDFARTETRLGSGPVIEHQNVGFMLADIKMRVEACRYLTWKACHDFDRTGGRAQELAIMTKVYCSEAAVSTIYDCMRVVGIASYTRDLAPLERIMRDAMVFPLYDGGNQGVRRRQLHDMFRQPGYDSMLAARGDVPPWEQ